MKEEEYNNLKKIITDINAINALIKDSEKLLNQKIIELSSAMLSIERDDAYKLRLKIQDDKISLSYEKIPGDQLEILIK